MKTLVRRALSLPFDRNLGGWDRAARVAVGAAVTALAYAGPESPWGLLGLAPLLTGLLGRCPVYPVIGWSTK